VTELLQDVATVTVATSNRYVWRGVRDADYLLHSSLHRRLTNADIEVTNTSLVEHETALIQRAKDAGFNRADGLSLSDGNLLARLQHVGASTSLLDVTPDPFIGLFFATEPVGPNTPCALLAIRIPGRTEAEQSAHTYKGAIPLQRETRVSDVGIYESLRSQKGVVSEEGEPILWEAPFVDERMRAQRGMFLATTAPPSWLTYGSFDAGLRDPDDERSSVNNLLTHNRGRYQRPSLIVFYINKVMRIQVARELDRRFGYRTQTIYPDLAGFALANSSDRPFQ
jgi:hypothetical protein